ncbi:MAG: hypothetical protein Q8P67_24655 [archaeon]|nr:hypothetical protein [archaeon]
MEEALRAERQEGGKIVTASKKRQAPEPSSSAASHGKGKKLAEKARRKAHVPEGDSSEEEDMFDTTKLVPYNQGVVYVGRIPHGFYEDQMRGFFSQFGRVVNLRVSRSKKSGKSKHYAFVQFETPVVADIVAQAMDNYLMFHRIVKCKLMAPEDVHPQIWKGANTVYRPVDTSKKAALLHNRTDATPDSLRRRVSRLKQQDQKLRAHLALKGIHYDLPPFDSEDTPAPKKQRTAAGSKSLDAQPKSDKSVSKFFKKSAPEVASPNSSSKKTVASLTSKTPSSSTSKAVSKTSTSKTAVAEVPKSKSKVAAVEIPKSKSKVAAVVPKPKAAAGTKPKPVTATPDVSEVAKPKSRSVADLTKLKSAAKAPATTPSLIKTRKRTDTPDPRRR